MENQTEDASFTGEHTVSAPSEYVEKEVDTGASEEVWEGIKKFKMSENLKDVAEEAADRLQKSESPEEEIDEWADELAEKFVGSDESDKDE